MKTTLAQQRKAMQHVLRLIRKRTIEIPIRSKDIGILVGYGEATIRHFVTTLRREGHPIAMNRKGYFWVKKKEDMQPTVDNIAKRLETLGQTIQTIQKLLKKLKV